MRILFMGTPEFAVPSLEALIDKHNVIGVVTQPDKPKGRGHKLTPPPVKECAIKHGIPVFQPSTLKDNEFAELLAKLSPELIVVVAYGKLLPKNVLDFPAFGCINVHASILPKYRGAAPIEWSIINGEKETGITTMYMAEGLDTGDMLLIERIPITPDDTAGSLHDKLMAMGAEVLVETIEKLENNSIARIPQDDSLSCYAPMLNRETGKIDWSKSAREIVDLVRGVNPYPLAYTIYKGAKMKVISAVVGNKRYENLECGKIIGILDNSLEVAARDGYTVLINEIQMENSKRMNVASYLNGHEFDLKETLCS